jgi:hypothetical protein
MESVFCNFLTKFSPIALFLFLELVLGGCATRVVTPQNIELQDGDTVYTTVGINGNEVEANNIAMRKAVDFCKSQNGKVIPLDRTSDYKGMSTNQKKLAILATEKLSVPEEIKTPYDYRATLKFKCVNSKKQTNQ